jgi:hypothetical protein
MTPQNLPDIVNVAATRFVTIRLAATIIGLTENAIRSKLKDGTWVLNRQYRKAPDNRIYIDLEGVQKWIMGKG